MKHVFKFFLHLANLWRNQSPQLGFDRWRRAQQVLDLKLLHLVRSVGLGAFSQRCFFVKVNLPVFVHHALGNLRSLGKLRLKVLFVLTSKFVDKMLASLELRQSLFADCDSRSATPCVLVNELDYGFSEESPRQSRVVLAVVAQHICKVLVFKSSEMRVLLVLFIGFLKVYCDLRAVFRQL